MFKILRRYPKFVLMVLMFILLIAGKLANNRLSYDTAAYFLK
jgi:hypothetical protein